VAWPATPAPKASARAGRAGAQGPGGAGAGAGTGLANLWGMAQANGGIDDREVQAVRRKLWQHGRSAGAQALADRLRDKPRAARATLLARLNDLEGTDVLRDLLRGAAGEVRQPSDRPLSVADQAGIAAALGEAYDGGQLPGSFVEQLLWLEENFSNPPCNERSAEMIAASGSPDLIRAFVDRSLLFARHSPRAGSLNLLLGAARAMAGDPAVLQDQLARLIAAGDLEAFLAQLAPSRRAHPAAGYDPADNALAALVNAAAAVQPPTAEVAALFAMVSQHHRGEPGVDDALGNLFATGDNARFLLAHPGARPPILDALGPIRDPRPAG
jgi:hypothetical protein